MAEGGLINVSSWEKQQNSFDEYPFSRSYALLQYVVATYITPGLCIIGIIGNIVNLIVLTRVRFYKVEGSKERGANIGLVALAISDTVFCLAVFPTVFNDHAQILFPEKCFQLYYQVYGTGLVTTFILSSTWIIVTLALLRYIAICHPLTHRRFSSSQLIKFIYAVVIFVSILINIPTFFQYQITVIPYTEDRILYMIDLGYLDGMNKISKAFQWIRFAVFIAIPAIIIVFSNFSLVQTLRLSNRARQQYCSQTRTNHRQNRITLLLVIIAVGFIFLVLPSELMDFFVEFIRMNHSRTEIFLTLRVIANTMQMISFSCNFILYCALNVHFRRVLKDIILCRSHFPTKPVISSLQVKEEEDERFIEISALPSDSQKQTENEDFSCLVDLSRDKLKSTRPLARTKQTRI